MTVTSRYLAAGLLAQGCITNEVDLRPPTVEPQPGDDGCQWRERINPATGACEPCEYLSPHPAFGCLCNWVYQAADFPYCSSFEAYYECLSCNPGAIESCNVYDSLTHTTTDCVRLDACCQELASHPVSTPCCSDGETLTCTAGDSDYDVRCL